MVFNNAFDCELNAANFFFTLYYDANVLNIILGLGNKKCFN